jgi:signal transduction histidine kinase
VAQEALTNIEKHTRARYVAVELHITTQQARLVVQDDGPGLAPETEMFSPTYGLRGMRERIEGLGGRFNLTSQDGFRLEAIIPV